MPQESEELAGIRRQIKKLGWELVVESEMGPDKWRASTHRGDGLKVSVDMGVSDTGPTAEFAAGRVLQALLER